MMGSFIFNCHESVKMQTVKAIKANYNLISSVDD